MEFGATQFKQCRMSGCNAVLAYVGDPQPVQPQLCDRLARRGESDLIGKRLRKPERAVRPRRDTDGIALRLEPGTWRYYSRRCGRSGGKAQHDDRQPKFTDRYFWKL